LSFVDDILLISIKENDCGEEEVNSEVGRSVLPEALQDGYGWIAKIFWRGIPSLEPKKAVANDYFAHCRSHNRYRLPCSERFCLL